MTLKIVYSVIAAALSEAEVSERGNSPISKKLHCRAGLSLRAGGRGFPPATMSVVPGYFYWKIEEK